MNRAERRVLFAVLAVAVLGGFMGWREYRLAEAKSASLDPVAPASDALRFPELPPARVTSGSVFRRDLIQIREGGR